MRLSPVRAPALLAALLALASAADAGAQERVTASGRVVDGVTQAPVAGAVLWIPSLKVRAVADQEGSFVLAEVPAGTHQTEVSRIGYTTLVERIEIGTGEPLTVNLLPQPVVLEGLTVTLNSLERRARRSGYAVQLARRDRIVTSSYLTALDYVHGAMRIQSASQLPWYDTANPEGPEAFDGRHPRRGANMAFVRGMQRDIRVVIDDQPAPGGVSELREIGAHEVHQIEWYAGVPALYVYTVPYVADLARGRRRASGIPPLGAVMH
jgi:hypothetical protein